MNKKVRVLKEMPFAKVGEELSFEDYFLMDAKTNSDVLFATGWLEWVEEEKSLEEKFEGEEA